MRTSIAALASLIIGVSVLGLGSPAAHGLPRHASPDSADVVATLNRFHAALAAGDSATASSLLALDAMIAESGTIETRADYRAHHLPADIEFARTVPSTRSMVRVSVLGDAAWVVSTSAAQGQIGGRTINSVGAELAVLRRNSTGWQITAVHWSSHARRPPS